MIQKETAANMLKIKIMAAGRVQRDLRVSSSLGEF